MIAIELDHTVKETRTKLLSNHRVFTGVASNPNVLRILPALCITKTEADFFLTALIETIQTLEA